jgi:hypothetical protein
MIDSRKNQSCCLRKTDTVSSHSLGSVQLRHKLQQSDSGFPAGEKFCVSKDYHWSQFTGSGILDLPVQL